MRLSFHFRLISSNLLFFESFSKRNVKLWKKPLSRQNFPETSIKLMIYYKPFVKDGMKGSNWWIEYRLSNFNFTQSGFLQTCRIYPQVWSNTWRIHPKIILDFREASWRPRRSLQFQQALYWLTVLLGNSYNLEKIQGMRLGNISSKSGKIETFSENKKM